MGPFGPKVASYVRPAAVNGSEVAGSINYKPQLDRLLSTANKLYRSLSEARAREYSLMGLPECVRSKTLSRLLIAISLECKNRPFLLFFLFLPRPRFGRHF